VASFPVPVIVIYPQSQQLATKKVTAGKKLCQPYDFKALFLLMGGVRPEQRSSMARYNIRQSRG
jgi:hypothetical protein